MVLKHTFYILISLTSFVFTFYSTGKFMYFLSVPLKSTTTTTTTTNNNGNKIKFSEIFAGGKWMLVSDSIVLSLLTNSLLLSTFMFQHSFMALPKYKEFLDKRGLSVISRSVYNLLTSIVLLVTSVFSWCICCMIRYDSLYFYRFWFSIGLLLQMLQFGT